MRPKAALAILLVVAGPVLSSCYDIHCTLNPPVAPAAPTDVPLTISTFSFDHDFPTTDEAIYTRELEQTLVSYGDPVFVRLEDSDRSNHLHVSMHEAYLDFSGLGYLGFLTLFLVPISHTYEAAFVFTYIYYSDGIPVREASFKIRQRVTQSIFHSAGLASITSNQELRLFQESMRAFLNGSGGVGARLDGVACLVPDEARYWLRPRPLPAGGGA